jgi:hypothetical protein
VRVARSRGLIAAGHRPAVVARVAGISRQAVYRPGARRPVAAGPGRASPDDQLTVEVATANPTDGTRMAAALASRELSRSVNPKRVQRTMRAHRLLQPSRCADRRRRPGFLPNAPCGCVVAHGHDQGVDRPARQGLSARDDRLLHWRAGGLVVGAALP